MSVLVYVDQEGGSVKKSGLEAINVASGLGEVQVLCFGDLDSESQEEAKKYGAQKIHICQNKVVGSKEGAKCLRQAMEKLETQTLVLAHNAKGRAYGPRVAAQLDAGMVSAVSQARLEGTHIRVTRALFSGKGIGHFLITSPYKVISVAPNSTSLEERPAAGELSTIELEAQPSAAKLLETKMEAGESVPLPEAEVVVSGGRGLKGPENWNLVEELAKVLNAATACSRPVSDSGWRPHHEHVGQTGLAIQPNLYFAIAISGAIQHLAGVNNSKVIVVINKDAEAPFFKAADYGVVGDAFEVVPRLTEALKKFYGKA